MATACVVAAGGLLRAQLRQVDQPYEVAVSILRLGEPATPELAGDPFEVAIAIPQGEDPPAVVASGEPPTATLEVPRMGEETTVAIVVRHPAYELATREMKLGEASHGVTIEATPKPVLAISLVPPPPTPERIADFEVAAWAAGRRDRSTSRRPDANGEAIFLAARHQEWLVSVTDFDRQRRHLSPAIPIDRDRELYPIDLGDSQTFR